MAPPPAAGREKERPEDPDTHIRTPGPNDVLLGRGGGTNNHEGNVSFRALVAEHKIRYLDATKIDKPKVAREVVKLWRAMEPPGRFLARVSGTGPVTTRNEGALWYDVGDKKAREKASQCLRERTPDVMPYVQNLSRKKAEEFNKTVTAVAAATASSASLLSASGGPQSATASASQLSFGGMGGGGGGGAATLSSSSLLSGCGISLPPPPHVGPDELDDFLEMQQRQIDAQQAFLAEQQLRLAAATGGAAGGAGGAAGAGAANPAVVAEARAMMSQGMGMGMAVPDAAASMHSLFSLGSLGSMGSINGSLRSLGGGGAGGAGGAGAGGAGGGVDAANSLKSVTSNTGNGGNGTTTTNNNNKNNSAEAANSMRSIGSMSMGMAAGIGGSMKSIGSIPMSTASGNLAGAGVGAGVGVGVGVSVPGSMRSINTGISSIGSGPDTGGTATGGGGVGWPGGQMNLMGGAMQMPQLPPNATPQQKQAFLMHMQMAQQQQAMLMQQQAAILQQRQHLQQAAEANAQAQAKVRAQMEAAQRRRSSEGPYVAPLSESATSSGSAGAPPSAAANPPSAQSSAANLAGQGPLANITPEMAAQFGIDPSMLAKLQSAAAAQAVANAGAVGDGSGRNPWEPTPVGPRPASAGPYALDTARKLMAQTEKSSAPANSGSNNENEEEGELTLEEYTSSLEEYIQREVGHIVIKDEPDDDLLTKVSGAMSAGTGASSLNPLNDLRAQLAEHKSNSWVKNFHALEDDMMDASFMSGSGSFNFEGSLADLTKTSEPSKDSSSSKPTSPQDRQNQQQQQQQQQQQKRRAMSSTRSQASTDERSRSKYGKAQRSGPGVGGEHPSMPPPAINAGRGRGADGAPRRRRKQKVEIIQPATIGEDMPTAGGVDAEGMSLFSGDSLFSAGLSMGDGTRVSKDSKTKHLRSDISMMSELTDLSDAASKMSIGR